MGRRLRRLLAPVVALHNRRSLALGAAFWGVAGASFRSSLRPNSDKPVAPVVASGGEGGQGGRPGQAGQPAGQASQLAKGARRRSFLRAAFAAWGATAGSRPASWLLVCPARRSNGGLRPRRPQVDTHTEVGAPLFKKIYARTASSRGLAPHTSDGPQPTSQTPVSFPRKIARLCAVGSPTARAPPLVPTTRAQ